jgi:hypothetical protein
VLNIVGDRVKQCRRAVESLDSVLGGRDIPINVRTSVLKTCILPVLTYGCKVWGMDSTSGANRLQTISSHCLRRLVGVGAKAPRVATAPLLRELGIAPIEGVAAAARTRSFLKAPTLNTFISDLVRHPSRMHRNTWTSETVRWLDRFARASAELAQNVRVPPTWRSLQPRVAAYLVKAAVWGRFETSSSACTNTWSIYFHASYVGNPLPQYGTGIPAGAVAGLDIMIQLRTRVLPTARRLARTHAMHERFLHHCPACGGDVPESI